VVLESFTKTKQVMPKARTTDFEKVKRWVLSPSGENSVIPHCKSMDKIGPNQPWALLGLMKYK
jgi:hypothetical protein